MKRHPNRLAYAVFAALALGGCSHGGTSGSAPDGVGVPDPPVDATEHIRSRLTMAELQPAEAQTIVHLPAEVEVPPTARHALAPPHEGLLTSIGVEVGDVVEPGSVLAELRSPDLSSLRASEAEWSRIARDRREHASRLEEQVAAGYQTAVPLYDAELAANEAEASARRYRVEREALQSWVTDVERDGRWTWRSGVRGVVTEVHCSVGVRVPPSSVCLTVVDVDRAEVRVDIPERHTSRISDQLRLQFHPHDGSPARTLVYRRRAPTMNAANRSLPVYFADATGAAVPVLPVGATGRGELLDDAGDDSFAVPAAAVTELQGHDVVFVDAGSGELPHAVPVRVVGRRGERMLVTGDGLAAGTTYVERGAFLLRSVFLTRGE